MNPVEALDAELLTRAAKIAHDIYLSVEHPLRSNERVRDETLIALGVEAGFAVALGAFEHARARPFGLEKRG